jgi:hypothetical protein
MVDANVLKFSIMIIIGAVSFVLLMVILFFFGKLIKHQIKIFFLRNRGYVQLRHIREDMNENNYFIRVKNDVYDVSGGVYLDQKDTKTKAQDILQKLDYDLLSKKPEVELNAIEKQFLQFFNNINSNNKLMDIKTLSWGIPTITYFGNNPNPVNYRDIKKVYDAKNISAMIKRLLMTKEWKLVRMVLLISAVAMIGLLVLGFIDAKISSNNAINLKTCQYMLNQSINNNFIMFNNTIVPALHQNSTVII